MAATRPYIRPGSLLRRLVSPIVVRLGVATTLIVRGRTTGKLLKVPLGAPLELDGTRNLVSGRGNTHWVRNLRAAGEAALRAHGRTERFRAVELDGAERERIVAAYRAMLGRSLDGYFAEIPNPADHPVFRIDPLG